MDQLLSSDLLMGYGLMNKISTGWPLLDTLLCLFIPILLKTAIPWLTNIVSDFFTTPEDSGPGNYTRVIEFTKVNDYWWYYDDDSSEPANSELQRALLNQINHCCQVLKELPNAEFQLRKKPQKPQQDAPAQAKSESDEDGNDNDGQPEQYDYMVNHVPALDTWVDLKNGISLMRSREETQTQSGSTTTSTTTTKFFLRSCAKDGEAKVNKFVEDALSLYKEQQAGKVDHARYLYVPVLNTFGTKKDEAPGTAQYKRYKLSEERTFESLFHPDKAPILHLVDQFLHKQGKFGIPGYPQKLGFLLYGPPGTGKTSFIKALSQYTKRSVISIPLSKISTNQELMDIMFDQKISVEGQDSINLSHAKTIFVMEDVDAASHVVSRRADATPPASLAAVAKQIKAAAANDTSDEDDQDRQKDGDAEEDTNNSTQPKQLQQNNKKKAKVKKDKSDLSIGPTAQKWLAREDELNLAGLLNVLDGVVDTPNRIIIMTTNHPEKLDPALIRPGRINKKIYMGRIRLPEALSMMRHYFGDVSPQLEARLRCTFIDEALSPAEVEAMCADFDTAEDMVEQLEAKFGGRYMQPDSTPYVKAL